MSAISQLDADEIFAVRDNLQSASKKSDGPPARIVPEGLCDEINQILRLVELEIRSLKNLGLQD